VVYTTGCEPVSVGFDSHQTPQSPFRDDLVTKYKTTTVDGIEYALVPVSNLFDMLETCERMGYYDSAGVDNWSGRDYALDEMREDNFFKNFENKEWLEEQFLDRG
jgi:hypothetical protein